MAAKKRKIIGSKEGFAGLAMGAVGLAALLIWGKAITFEKFMILFMGLLAVLGAMALVNHLLNVRTHKRAFLDARLALHAGDLTNACELFKLAMRTAFLAKRRREERFWKSLDGLTAVYDAAGLAVDVAAIRELRQDLSLARRQHRDPENRGSLTDLGDAVVAEIHSRFQQAVEQLPTLGEGGEAEAETG